ncbi:hypothetical protein N658DRAFT_491161 [Parathielavia hyrcaniae]|uniref:Uncharacterized protein n=1 Tax=Parathielavia hyrcaniae TaxID=113614 RepID=A0AAN6QAA1_9PEZI|nr:hypothetical protein N658DRAFT_491161 [Parathielavia hyrcaniae]
MATTCAARSPSRLQAGPSYERSLSLMNEGPSDAEFNKITNCFPGLYRGRESDWFEPRHCNLEVKGMKQRE